MQPADKNSLKFIHDMYQVIHRPMKHCSSSKYLSLEDYQNRDCGNPDFDKDKKDSQ